MTILTINTSKRSIKLKDALSAGIITGTDKIRSGYGNGDCLLCDFSHGVFAVADASERYPWASRKLLTRLSKCFTKEDVSCNSTQLQVCTDKIYARQKFNDRSTFSCIAISQVNDGIHVAISHGGDSMVIIADSSNGSILYNTAPDMNFAGRIKHISNTSTMILTDPNCRIILATDGFIDAMHLFNEATNDSDSSHILSSGLLKKIATAPAHEGIEQLQQILELNNGKAEYDDIGMIIIDPFKINTYKGKSIIWGGTTPNEEQMYINYSSSDVFHQWLPETLWGNYTEMFGIAGIQIIDG